MLNGEKVPRCTDAVTDAVVRLIRAGVAPAVAAQTEGVERPLFDLWMRRGASNGQGEYRFARFRDAVLRAEAECEAFLVARVRSSAADSWQAAAWLAERRFGERWQRKSIVEDGKPAVTAGEDPFADLDNVTPIRRA